MASVNDTELDLVVYGASSFVGQILCEYLARRHGTDGGQLRWALAGRSRERLEAVRAELGEDSDALPLIVADADDEESLRSLCARTRVVVSTAGPYALIGEPLLRSCVESGTDYCDITGELQWIRRMMARYDDIARQTGARIVHCCGFDSIPSDLGVHYLQQHCRQRFGMPASQVKMRIRAMRGGLSGGTAASLMNVIREASKDPRLRRELNDPYALCPPDHPFVVRQPTVPMVAHDPDFDAWVAPFIMAAINTRVVLRSNALNGAAWGRDFQYQEASLTGRGLRGWLRAFGMGLGLRLFMLVALFAPTRWLLERLVLPAPGEGPDRETREAGFFDMRFHATTGSGQMLRVRVTGDQDPGYGSTAKMLGEAAACLALDDPDTEGQGGFWTPATALGDALLRRLEAQAGLSFQVCE